MPFRAPLDLSGILARHVPIGRVIEGGGPVSLAAMDDGFCFAAQPVRLGMGPDRWSTSTALVPAVVVCADVNGYYRELGVDWRATRKELAEAYMALEGQSSARLTYVFKQLLDSRTREAYDKTKVGESFFDDYTSEALRRKASAEAGRRSLRGQSASVDSVMDEWGYVILPDDEVDSVSPMRQDQSQQRDLPWKYSYYAWKTTSYLQDEKLLRQWQGLLSTAASRCGAAPQLAIGLTAMSDGPFMIESVADKAVIFFAEGTAPHISIAEKAVEHLLRIPSDPQNLLMESGTQ